VTSPREEGARLTRDAVITQALAAIERDGVEAFSMRGLARELGVHPGSVYWHVADREVLLAEVTARVLAEITLPDPALPWDSWLVEYARSYRRALHRHPNVVPLINYNLASNSASAFGAVEALLMQLERAGFRDQGVVDAFNVVVGSMVGFVGLELAPLPSGSAEAWQQARKEELDELPTTEFPMLTKYRTLVANRAFVTRWLPGEEAPLDGAFEALLDVIVRGLRARLGG